MVGRLRRGEAKPRANSHDQEALLRLGGRLSPRGCLTRRRTAFRHGVRAPHRAERCPPRPGEALRLPRPGRCRRADAARRVGRVPVPGVRVAVAGVPGPDRRFRRRLGEAAPAGGARATAGREPACGACLAVSRPPRSLGGRRAGRGAPKARGRGPAGGRRARRARRPGAPLCHNQRPTNACT